MIRRLFTIMSSVSLVLFVVTVIMWVRSYTYSEGGPILLTNTLVGFESVRGDFAVRWRVDGNLVSKPEVRWTAIPLANFPGWAYSVPEEALGAAGVRYWAIDMGVENSAKPAKLRFV